MHEKFEADLRDLAGKGRLRSLRSRAGLDFTSNDYLGLAESDELKRAAADAIARGVPVGSGGSRPPSAGSRPASARKQRSPSAAWIQTWLRRCFLVQCMAS